MLKDRTRERRVEDSPKVPQHEGSGKDDSGRVGDVLSHDVLGDVSIELKQKKGRGQLRSWNEVFRSD